MSTSPHHQRNTTRIARPKAAAKATRMSDAQTLMTRLECDLGISREQAPAWRRFAAAVDANATRLQRQRRSPARSAGAAVETIAGMRATLREHAVAMDAMHTAVVPLYTQLTPRQRRKADQLLPLCCPPDSHGDL